MNSNKHQQSQLTDFQRRVYEALLKIPKGKVTTYKILAQHTKCGSYRAVGQALKRNPFAPRVPCHRVIASDLTIGGFQGCRNGTPIKKKLRLLKKEGVEFKNGRLANQSLIYQRGRDALLASLKRFAETSRRIRKKF